MASLGDDLRFAWLPGLNDVSGRPLRSVAGWIASEEFQVYYPPEETRFELHVGDSENLLRSYAFEINRILSAAVETMLLVNSVKNDERSLAWTMIQTYYAGFFAAHALLRVWGHSCDILNRSSAHSIGKLANVYGLPGRPIKGGLYVCVFNPSMYSLKGSKLNNGADGPHETLWTLFDEHLKLLAEKVLTIKSSLIVSEAQLINAKLEDLRTNLSHDGARRGAWLPKIRKAINYDQELGVWYPYREKKAYYRQVTKVKADWNMASMEIALRDPQASDLRRFQTTCNFIVALALETSAAMSSRCSKGKSFQDFGALAILNHHRPLIAT